MKTIKFLLITCVIASGIFVISCKKKEEKRNPERTEITSGIDEMLDDSISTDSIPTDTIK